MKVGIATTLSIAGVLAAGAAAYAVNSSVLGASSSVTATASGTPAVDAVNTLPAQVKVPFISSTARIEFLARLVDGKVTVSVKSQPIAPPKPKPTYSDDDDDNNHDDDHDDKKEHERDDEKEREHDEDEDDD